MTIYSFHHHWRAFHHHFTIIEKLHRLTWCLISFDYEEGARYWEDCEYIQGTLWTHLLHSEKSSVSKGIYYLFDLKSMKLKKKIFNLYFVLNIASCQRKYLYYHIFVHICTYITFSLFLDIFNHWWLENKHLVWRC